VTAAPRVLLACDFFLKYTANLARGLADCGCEVTLLSRAHGLEFGGDPDAMWRFLHETLDGGVRHVVLPGRVRDVGRLPALVATARAARRPAPDVVHVQDDVAVNDPRLLLAAGPRPRRYAVTLHDPEPHPERDGGKRRLALARRALLRGAGLVFVHAEAYREEAERLSGGGASVVVVPHGARPARIRALPDRPSLLFFGRLAYYKGLDTLLDAMPRIWAQAPEVGLTIAGSGPLVDHPVLADPRVVLRHEHISEHEVPSLFAGATCLVLPYRQASQSGVGSLAQQHGRAVIATAVGGLPELIRPEHGRLVPPEDPSALAGAVLDVLAEPGLAARMGAAASAAVAAESSWRRVAERTLDAYESSLLAERPRRRAVPTPAAGEGAPGA
jgi:glycosyltransferase involved in cell wall biosynthesis